MADHSRIAPSGAPQWAICAGSLQLQEQFPETERSEAAEEGEASHWVGESVLSAVNSLSAVLLVGQIAPNGVVVTDKMIEAADVYIEDISETTGVRDLQLETRITAPRIHELCWGTCDCWWFDPTTNTLHVWDYKYGWGLVEAYENWQVLCYVIGLIDMLIGRGLVEQAITVDMRVVQPRPYHSDGPIRSWKVNAVELRPYANILFNKAGEALGPDPTTRVGEHCKNCTARHACLTSQRAAGVAMDIAGQATPHILSPEALGSELVLLKRAYDAIKNRLTGYEAQALGLLKGGMFVPGWACEEGKGNVAWGKPVGEVIALGELYGKDLRKPEATITPGQAEKQGIPAELIAAYSTVPQRGLKLVRDNGNKAKQIFKT